MNKTVIKGTPLQNSIKPTEMYLIKGKLDLLPQCGLANINTKEFYFVAVIFASLSRRTAPSLNGGHG